MAVTATAGAAKYDGRAHRGEDDTGYQIGQYASIDLSPGTR